VVVSFTYMELRKDPITRSWVITGDDVPEVVPRSEVECRFCAASTLATQIVSSSPGLEGNPWSARSVVHPTPLYRIEGEPARRGDGLYDRMRSVGAHEVLIENPRHDRQLWNASDREIEQFLLLAAQRIQDLKRDSRFKYVSIFKNHGASAGQEFEHPTSQLTATTFVPRRVLYELRAGRDYYEKKERCVFCDILQQEERQNLRVLEIRGEYVALCPYAPRVPYLSVPRWRSQRSWRILERYSVERCSESGRLRRSSTWSYTPRPTACSNRKAWVTGRPSTRIITGMWKSCPFWRPRISRTRSKRSTTHP
jgi:galactose-1-phosphate uridylyltransferase